VYYHGGGIYPSAIGYSVLQTADGGYVIAGECDGCFYFFKTDPQGNTLWYNMDSIGTVQSILQTNDGGFILVGYTIDDWNMFDVYLARSDSDGNILWTREYGGGCDDVANSIQQTSDGGYIITGHTESFGPGFEDVWLLRTDASGETLWTETYGGITADIGNNVQQTVDGGYIIVGSTASFGAGGSDIYIIKTEPDVGIEENEPAAINNREITSTVFRGTLQLPEGKKCVIYDITGRIVEPATIAPGIYFLEVDYKIVQKVVKVR
jgi:hypothetical protein